MGKRQTHRYIYISLSGLSAPTMAAHPPGSHCCWYSLLQMFPYSEQERESQHSVPLSLEIDYLPLGLGRNIWQEDRSGSSGLRRQEKCCLPPSAWFCNCVLDFRPSQGA